MKIAVTVAVYNEEKNISYFVDSIIQQTVLPDELIIVNDGSTDNTYNILKELSNKIKLLKIITQKNTGPAAARNKAWRNANADICIFTDGDCIPEKNWIEEIIKPFRADSIGAVGGTYKTINTNSALARFIGYEIAWRYKDIKGEIEAHGTYNLAVRKAILNKIGGLNEKYPKASGEDWDMTYKISKISKIIYSPSAIVGHYHPDNFLWYMKNQVRRGIDRVRVYKDHPDKISNDNYTGKLIKYQVLAACIYPPSLLLIFPIFSYSWLIPFLIFFFIFLSTFQSFLFVYKKDIIAAIYGLPILLARNFAWASGLLIGICKVYFLEKNKNKESNPKELNWNNFWNLNVNSRFTRVSHSKKKIIDILNRFLIADNKILDAGTGSGFFANYFISKKLIVYALDYSEKALDIAKNSTQNRCKDYIKLNLLEDEITYKYNNYFDYIFTDGLFEHFDKNNQNTIMEHFNKILKPGGILFTFVPNKYSWWTIARPFVMPGINEKPFTMNRIVKLHNIFNLLETGGINIIPTFFSPDKHLGKYLGMLLYVIARKK